MRWKVLCLILNLVTFQLVAQWRDDFNKDTLFWNGDLDFFKIENHELVSNCSISNQRFGLSHMLTLEDTMVWSFDVKLLFNTSSLNYVDVFLIGDSSNLPLSQNALFLRLGGAKDDVSLIEIVNGVQGVLLDGPDGFLNQTKNEIHLNVLKTESDWSVEYIGNSEKNFYKLGSVSKSINPSMTNTGFYIKQSTVSFFYKHHFDNWYSGPWLKDSILPRCVNVKCLNNKSLRLFMSEPIILPQTADFLSNHCNCTPDSLSFDSASAQLYLYFNQSIDSNRYFQLRIKKITDYEGNTSVDETFDFLFFNIYIAEIHDLIITELMVDPEPSQGLPETEYIEIKNISKKFISTKNLLLCDPNNCVPLKDTVVFPDSFLLVYNGPSLNNSSDDIRLMNDSARVLHRVSYSLEDYGDDNKSNGGYSLEMIDPYQLCLPNNWKASVATLGGTPGASNSVDFRRLPDTIPPKILNVISKGLELKLELSETPDFSKINPVFLLNGQVLTAGKLNDNVLTFSLLNELNPDSLHLLVSSNLSDCSGNFVPKQELTFKTISTPRQFDLVFNEILFNPYVGGKDFIELYQTSNRLFDLSEVFVADIERGGLLHTIYPLSTKSRLSKAQAYTVISEDTANICENYQCGRKDAMYLNVPKLPSMPDDGGTLVLVNLRGEFIDSITYTREMHHPLYKSEDGVSLERLIESAELSKSDYWYSASSESGFATPGRRNSQYLDINHSQGLSFQLKSKTIAPKPDAFLDLLVIEYELNKPDFVCSMDIYDAGGHLVKHLLNNQTIGNSGIVTWNGLGDGDEELLTGVYVLNIKGFYPDGTIYKKVLSFALLKE